jgi:hypothetical protein
MRPATSSQNDLVERLDALFKLLPTYPQKGVVRDAVDEIRRLQAHIKQLQASCKSWYEQNTTLIADRDRLQVGLRMLATEEYDAGYSPQDYARAVLSGDEPIAEIERLKGELERALQMGQWVSGLSSK